MIAEFAACAHLKSSLRLFRIKYAQDPDFAPIIDTDNDADGDGEDASGSQPEAGDASEDVRNHEFIPPLSQLISAAQSQSLPRISRLTSLL